MMDDYQSLLTIDRSRSRHLKAAGVFATAMGVCFLIAGFGLQPDFLKWIPKEPYRVLVAVAGLINLFGCAEFVIKAFDPRPALTAGSGGLMVRRVLNPVFVPWSDVIEFGETNEHGQFFVIKTKERELKIMDTVDGETIADVRSRLQGAWKSAHG